MKELLDKVALSIARLKTFEPPDGYYLAFSGGKDSQVLYHVAQESGVKFDAHMNLTTVDPPEVIQFVRKYYKEVKLERPKETMWRLIERKGFPPTQRIRYCCEELKERGGEGRYVITGIRSQESYKRSLRRMVEVCKFTHRQMLHPIIDWTEAEVWEYLNSRGIPHCELYDQGWHRIGCIMCPMGGPDRMKRDAARWPKVARSYLMAFDRGINKAIRAGKIINNKTGKDMFAWWISGVSSTCNRTDIKQSPLFFDADLGQVQDE